MEIIKKIKIDMAVMVISCNMLLYSLSYGRRLPHQLNKKIPGE